MNMAIAVFWLSSRFRRCSSVHGAERKGVRGDGGCFVSGAYSWRAIQPTYAVGVARHSPCPRCLPHRLLRSPPRLLRLEGEPEEQLMVTPGIVAPFGDPEDTDFSFPLASFSQCHVIALTGPETFLLRPLHRTAPVTTSPAVSNAPGAAEAHRLEAIPIKGRSGTDTPAGVIPIPRRPGGGDPPASKSPIENAPE